VSCAVKSSQEAASCQAVSWYDREVGAEGAEGALTSKPPLICALTPQLETSLERVFIGTWTGPGWQLLELRNIATSQHNLFGLKGFTQ
jgi:hypothetical protein